MMDLILRDVVNNLSIEKNALAKENKELKAKLERVKALYDPLGEIWDVI